MRIKCLIICFLVIASLPGCSVLETIKEADQNEFIYELAINEIANLIQLKCHPMETVINLKNTDKLHKSVKRRLKIRGFGLSEKVGTETEYLITIIENIQAVNIAVKLDKQTLSRMYTYEIQTKKLIPSSGISIRGE